VLDAVSESAARLCEAYDAVIYRLADDRLVLAAHHGPIPVGRLGETWLPLGRGTANGRAMLEARTVHVADQQAEVGNFPEGSEIARQRGYRTVLVVPLVRDGVPIGTIGLRRTEVRLFTERQVSLLQTFSDQAVIAIENVRLFTELQEKNRALTQAHAQVIEALDQQTATSEILRTIAHAQTDVVPVFETIVRNAARLCQATSSFVWLLEGDRFRVVAPYNVPSDSPSELGVADAPNLIRVFDDGTALHVGDTESDPRMTSRALEMTQAMGARATLMVPMRRDLEAIGSLMVLRDSPGAFTDGQIELLKTFADQAVIAIENVRLFNELQASNRELTTALDQQTATSDILRVISQSQTDVQPVFDAIVASAVRLLGAYTGGLTRVAGDQLELAALTGHDAAGAAAVRATFPRSMQSETPHAQAIRDRAPLNIAEYATDPRLPEAYRASAAIRGYRSLVVVPMLLHDEGVGSIGVTRREPGGFTNDEFALLKTFADQAVIAIENARLLTELQARTQELTRSVEQLTALGDVGRAVSSSLDLDTVLTTIVGRAVQLSGTDGGTIFEYDEGTEEFVPRATLNADESQSAMLRATRLRRGEGAVGQMAVTREPLQISDIAAKGAYESRLRGRCSRRGRAPCSRFRCSMRSASSGALS
jgi:GAF domain-containing protein